ncbi:MAG: hypothetical protein WCR28_07200, partial [Candidatus Izemoplasmatales bacterium]
DKKVVAITDEYVTYEVIFRADAASYEGVTQWNAAKLQFMYGYLPTDAANKIYVKEFKLIPAAQPVTTEIADLAPNHVLTGTVERFTQAVDTVENAVVITDIPAFTETWNTSRVTNYYNQTRLEMGSTYRFKITAKATTATELRFRIGTVLGADPWIDDFEGGRQTLMISDSYATYTIEFTVNKENYVSVNNAKFEFTFGYLSDTENTIYIKDFVLEKIVYPLAIDQILIDDFTYADEEAFEEIWTQRTSGADVNPGPLMNLDVDNEAMIFSIPTVQDGWHVARKYDSLLSFGATDQHKYLAFYMTNNTSQTAAHVWFYWSESQNSFPITFPAIGETGWAVIDVSVTGKTATQITDFGIGFNNWPANGFSGSLTIYQVTLVKNPEELAKINVSLPPTYHVLDSYDYDTEDDFEAAWLQRTHGSDVNPGPLMNLDAETNSLVLAMPETHTGWHIAKSVSSLQAMGGSADTKYLAFYLTNNTNKLSASIWLYWSGNQSSHKVTMPATGKSGWVFVDFNASGKTIDLITNIGLGFDGSGGAYTGSVTIHEVAMVDSIPKLLEMIEVVVPPRSKVLDYFDYEDEAAFEAAWTQRTSGADVNPGPLMNLDVENDAMIFNMPATANDGWHTARKYASLASFGATDEMKYLAFYMTNNLNKRTAHMWLYWSGGMNSYALTLPRVGETGWAVIDVTKTGKTVSQITDFALGFNNWESNPYTGSVTVYAIAVVSDPAKLDLVSIVPSEPVVVNEAPVVAISNENLATLSGMLLEAGTDLTTLEATLLSVITITDAEDGAITPLATMIDYKGLVLSNPVRGTYQIEIATVDSEGLASNILTLPVSIVSVLNDLEGFADDAAFKASSLYYGIRTSGDAEWDSTGGLVSVGENNVVEVAYANKTNGIRINVTKAELTGLGVTYIGVYMKTSNPLTTSPKFQAFYYDTTHHEITNLQGSIAFINSGTYVYVPIASMSDTATSISIVINCNDPTPDAGMLTIDNFVFK